MSHNICLFCIFLIFLRSFLLLTPSPYSFPHYDHYLCKTQSNTQALHFKFTRENGRMWTQ